MDKKRTLLFVIVAGVLILLIWCVIAGIALNKWLTANKGTDIVATNITACDVDASGLCVVSFAVDNVNRMVINFQLPTADYAAFYVKAHHGETVSVYPCQVVETVPTSVYCTGERTPLGQPIEIEAYSTNGDALLAHGTLVVSAIALPTTINVTTTSTPGPLTPTVEVDTPTPTATLPPDVPTLTAAPFTPAPRPTSTPTTSGYP